MNRRAAIDLDLTAKALSSSTLNHGLGILGDRWTVQVMMGTFLGLRRFEQWRDQLAIPRHTLSQRLRALVRIDLLRPRPYQEKPVRHAYHATAKSMAMFPQVLMMWAWEQRWGTHQPGLPDALRHRACGHRFMPTLTCEACRTNADITAMAVRLEPVAALLTKNPSREGAPRMVRHERIDHRADRWTLLIVAAVVLGCHHFDELTAVLGIGSTTLTRRLASMTAAGLLRARPDRFDGRRRVYTLTPSSRDLLGYIVCLADWAGRTHLRQPSSIIALHQCGHRFRACVVCSHCREPLHAWAVQPEYGRGPTLAPDARAGLMPQSLEVTG